MFGSAKIVFVCNTQNDNCQSFIIYDYIFYAQGEKYVTCSNNKNDHINIKIFWRLGVPRSVSCWIRDLVSDSLEPDSPHHHHEEEEQLGLGQGLAHAGSLAMAEWDKVVWLGKLPLLINKSIRVEHFWVNP